MFTKFKEFLGRVRVRLVALSLTLLVLLGSLLDVLGLVDLRPMLTPIFGDRTEMALVIITIVLGVMKPCLAMIPKPADAQKVAVATLMMPEAVKPPQVTL